MCIRDSIERISDSEYLLWDVISAAVNVDNIVDIEYLPYEETGVVVDDEVITYLVMTKNTKGELTIPNVDRFYDDTIWSNPVDYCDGIMDKTDLNSYYITKDNITYVNKNKK